MLTRLLHLLQLTSAPAPSLSENLTALTAERETLLQGLATWGSTELWQQHPPQPEHAHKQRLLELAGQPPVGQIRVERYQQAAVPETFTPWAPDTQIVTRGGHFYYAVD